MHYTYQYDAEYASSFSAIVSSKSYKHAQSHEQYNDDENIYFCVHIYQTITTLLPRHVLEQVLRRLWLKLYVPSRHWADAPAELTVRGMDSELHFLLYSYKYRLALFERVLVYFGAGAGAGARVGAFTAGFGVGSATGAIAFSWMTGLTRQRLWLRNWLRRLYFRCGVLRYRRNNCRRYRYYLRRWIRSNRHDTGRGETQGTQPLF